jgi:urease accessory protein
MLRLMGQRIRHQFGLLETRSVLLIATFVFLTIPNTVQAHLVTSGVGPFFDGVAHFFVSLDDLLVVVALSLLSGLLGKPTARGLVFALPIAWLIGMVVGVFLANWINGSAWATAFTLLTAGLLLCIRPNVPTLGIALIASLIGIVHGSWNGAAMSATETSAIASIGILSGAGIVSLVLSATAVSVHQAWQIIAFRVIGSWVAAIGLLSFAWHFRSIV